MVSPCRIIETSTDWRIKRVEKALQEWFIAEDAFIEYFEQIEEEGAYPDLFGKTVTSNAKQYPEVYETAKDVCRILGIDVPLLFVQEDYDYSVDSEGLHRPRVEISARLIREFSLNEMRHKLAKELFHIAAGHLRFEVMTEKMLGVINAIPGLPGINMLQMFGSQLAFEAASFRLRSLAFKWWEYAVYSAENFAVSYTGDVASSVNATLMTVLNERSQIKALDLQTYLRQITAVECCVGPLATLDKIDEVHPYAPYRILNMLRFVLSNRGRALFALCGRSSTFRVNGERP